LSVSASFGGLFIEGVADTIADALADGVARKRAARAGISTESEHEY
jgi:hypothetical protein